MSGSRHEILPPDSRLQNGDSSQELLVEDFVELHQETNVLTADIAQQQEACPMLA